MLQVKGYKKIFITISTVLGFMLFIILFKGSPTPVYAEDILIPSFGNGQIKVRLYTDYFCNPCKALEPKLEPLIADLVKKSIINITFIDTPAHAQATLYAKKFLYILNEKKDLAYALRARSALFEAAKEKVTDDRKLETIIREKGFKLKPFDTKPTFNILSDYLKEDKINATPTCTIDNKGKKEKLTGNDIIGALISLR